MRSSIKSMVKAQLMVFPQGEDFIKNNIHLINQLVENQARAIIEEYGKPTRKREMLLKASTNILTVLQSQFPAGVISGRAILPKLF